MFNFLKDFGLPAYIAGIAALLTIIYRRTKEFQEVRFRSNKEQLDSIIDLFSDPKKTNNSFIVEQVFHFKFKAEIPHSIIKCLLMFPNPTAAIKHYIHGRRHLSFDENEMIIKYEKRMSYLEKRKFWKMVHLSSYFIFAFLGLSLIFSINTIMQYTDYYWGIITIPLALYFIWLAYEALISGARIISAEKIMYDAESMLSHNK